MLFHFDPPCYTKIWPISMEHELKYDPLSYQSYHQIWCPCTCICESLPCVQYLDSKCPYLNEALHYQLFLDMFNELMNHCLVNNTIVFSACIYEWTNCDIVINCIHVSCFSIFCKCPYFTLPNYLGINLYLNPIKQTIGMKKTLTLFPPLCNHKPRIQPVSSQILINNASPFRCGQCVRMTDELNIWIWLPIKDIMWWFSWSREVCSKG